MLFSSLTPLIFTTILGNQAITSALVATMMDAVVCREVFARTASAGVAIADPVADAVPAGSALAFAPCTVFAQQAGTAETVAGFAVAATRVSERAEQMPSVANPANRFFLVIPSHFTLLSKEL